MSRLKLDRCSAVTRLLAGAMAITLLLLAVLAADGRFHQALHLSGKASSDGCALCLFAKGQLDAPVSVIGVTPSLQPVFASAPRPELVLPVDLTYLAFPSRAPPVSFSSSAATA